MEYLVTLLHGTFAANAPWTNKGAPFCEKISQELKDHKVEFCCPTWSGKNSHAARIKAGDEFTKHLQKQLVTWPEKNKIIIAHSHGGNIALYALKNLGDDANKFKLITLATPFLNFSKRELKKNIDLYIIVIRVSLFFTFLALSVYFIMWALPVLLTKQLRDLSMSTKIISSISCLLFLGLTYLSFKFLLSKRVGKFIASKFNEIDVALEKDLEKISFTLSENSVKHLVLVDRGDEIRFWLGSLFKIWEILFGLQAGLNYFGRLIYLPTIIGILIFVILSINKMYIPTFLAVPIMGGIFLMFILFFSILLSAVLLIIKSNIISLGPEKLSYQMLIKTQPSIKPLNQQVDFKQFDFSRKFSFNLLYYLSQKHGIYEKSEAIEYLCNWIRTK